MSIQALSAGNVFDSPKYAQALKVDGISSLIVLSGQVSADKDGNNIHVGDFRDQAEAVLKQVKWLIEAGGSDLSRIIKLSVFLTDARNRPVFNEVRDTFFSGRLPPLSVIEVSGLMHPDWLIEIDAIAVAG